MRDRSISLKNVRVHNLKGINLKLSLGSFVVFTGLSGSGKSSLAFDTIYIEGQRRYIESLPNHARRYMGELPKPEADLIEGISPTIAIEQKRWGGNLRSTVGTITTIYDYLRLLFSKVATPHCPISGEEVKPQSSGHIIAAITRLPQWSHLIFLSPYLQGKKGEFKELFASLLRKGFSRIRLDGEIVSLEKEILVDKSIPHDIDLVVDHILLKEGEEKQIAEAVERSLELGNGVMSILDQKEKKEILFSQQAYARRSKTSYPPLQSQNFSFNHPLGMCPECEGLGIIRDFNLEKIINPKLSISEDCCLIAGSYSTVKWGNIYRSLAKIHAFSVKTAWENLPDRAKKIFLYGSQEEWTKISFKHPKKRRSWTEYIKWRGVIREAKERVSQAKSELYHKKMGSLMHEMVCPACNGARIKPYPAAATISGKTIQRLTSLTIEELSLFFEELLLPPLEEYIAHDIISEIKKRLSFLLNVGLHYLSLDRASPTLSGGEIQRVRLASQIGCGLVGTTYILDEPSIGLHPQDNIKLIHTLKLLQRRSNTVIVIEHDREMMEAADEIVDIGPAAGRFGGEVVAQGSISDLIKTPNSLTGAYLGGAKTISIPERRRKATHKKLVIEGARHHNLKEIKVEIPLGLFVSITGVSGSGKSSLVGGILCPALSNILNRAEKMVGRHRAIDGVKYLDKVISIDQSPIGRTPRSNPSTYTKVFDDIRDLFAMLPESQAAGFKPGRFSFNVGEGSCDHCRGMGMLRLNMDFLEDVWKTCPHCQGKRFDSRTLSILYKGKNIHHILDMSIEEALLFFENIPHIAHKLSLLKRVGLGYIKLGQPSTTLSGGEAQRIKLSREMMRPATGKTLYILDEPTTGLHFDDINKLIEILQHLVDRGNSVLVIEHNMDLVKTTDWIIDLGPEGGKNGGKIIATGPPELIAKLPTPTGVALNKNPSTPLPELPHHHLKPLTTIHASKCNQNNLKNLSIDIPREKISICTGPSGSGKSSFAFETIYAEGQRRYIESLPPYTRQFVKQMPKPKVEKVEGLSPPIAIEQKRHAGNPRSTIGTITEIYDFLRLLFAHMGTPYCPETGEKIEKIDKEYVVNHLMQLPSNTPIHVLAPVKIKGGDGIEEVKTLLIKKGFLRVRLNGKYHALDEEIPYQRNRKNSLYLVVDRLLIIPGIEKRLFDAVEQASHMSQEPFFVATDKEDILFNLAFAVPKTGKTYPPITPHTFSFNGEEGMCPHCLGLGLEHEVTDLDCQDASIPTSICSVAGSLPTHLPQEVGPCPTCHGERLNSLARHVRIGSMTIGKLCDLPLDKALSFIQTLEETSYLKDLLKDPIDQLKKRLSLLCHIGLDYLSLSRSAPTLSGGEIQRIHLARQLGSGLTECLYILDEPTIGLHPHNSAQLNEALKRLKNLGNTLLLVEHDPLILDIADHIFDFGPAAGSFGGKLSAQGSLAQIKENPHSLTGIYLSRKQLSISCAKKRRTPKSFLSIKYANKHNLKNLSVAIPTNALTCVTGVSGSGKSTLIDTILRRGVHAHLSRWFRDNDAIGLGVAFLSGLSAINKLIYIDQNPIGKTIRSDVSTYSDIHTLLRQFFASLPDARMRGLKPRHFSYNHTNGMCRSCEGLGFRWINLQFLPSVKIECDACHGNRLNSLSLTVTYKGKNLGQLLKLSVEESQTILPPIPKLHKILETLTSVGLGYLSLGQEIQSLSGGEAGRLRLSRELAKRPTGKTLYIFDEPTIGLHADDISKLLPIFHRLVDQGNTLVIIEHNLDIMCHADYIIDLGPGAGDRGGKLVVAGTPEEVAKHPTSYTAKYLANHLKLW